MAAYTSSHTGALIDNSISTILGTYVSYTAGQKFYLWTQSQKNCVVDFFFWGDSWARVGYSYNGGSPNVSVYICSFPKNPTYAEFGADSTGLWAKINYSSSDPAFYRILYHN